MQTELNILAIYGLLVALTLILQTLGAFQQLGMGYLLSSRDEHRTVQGIAARLERATNNSITGTPPWLPISGTLLSMSAMRLLLTAWPDASRPAVAQGRW